MGPVTLALFTWQRAQPQECLGHGARPVNGKQMPEVVRLSFVPALAHHLPQAAGRQRGEFLQRLEAEWQVWLDARAAYRPMPWQPGLRQHPSHGVMMRCTPSWRAMVPQRHFST
ncbi:hypothetical protein CS8_049920 [Cupriavidus sp. 8B]